MATQTCRLTINVPRKYRSIPTFPSTSLHGLSPKRPLHRSSVVVRAEQQFDIEKALAKAQEKFEAAENKPVVIGYGVGALIALLFTEWLIHLPGLDFLLGFPIQLVGVLMTPLLIIRYVIDKEDWYGDAEGAVDKVAGLLPGLKE